MKHLVPLPWMHFLWVIRNETQIESNKERKSDKLEPISVTESTGTHNLVPWKDSNTEKRFKTRT